MMIMAAYKQISSIVNEVCLLQRMMVFVGTTPQINVFKLCFIEHLCEKQSVTNFVSSNNSDSGARLCYVLINVVRIQCFYQQRPMNHRVKCSFLLIAF